MTLVTPPPRDQQEDDEMLVPHSDFPEGPQPMDVVQAENMSARRLTWTVYNFSRLTNKLCSDSFDVGDCKWRILVLPKGINATGHLSMYLDVVDSSTLPYGWSRYAQFSLTIVNQILYKYSIRKGKMCKLQAMPPNTLQVVQPKRVEIKDFSTNQVF
ncbi:ubiquitin C-terminal hydrolase 13-like isoform X2 [Prosopis cineraria]|uniref:ubiquitin C-terminal hydrolase 13-like isoform X2 n=1 Tax=Prosopis cineraria TaxID=364024 RepID=UPI0024101B9D|nr:ubiquitin C-terminal hydrolase 13-like isoform X2 [Prosopis cineraria]